MSIQNDVLVVLAFVSEELHSVADEASPMYSVPMRERAKELDAARATVAELIEALAEARAYVRMCTPAPDLPAEAWGRVMDRTGAALARCEGGAA